MKIDKYVKSLWDKADNLAKTNEIIAATTTAVYDDDYCIATGSTPIRFKAYRRARWEKLDDWGRLTCEDVDKTITQDELDFSLKRQFRIAPEDRYQHQK